MKANLMFCRSVVLHIWYGSMIDNTYLLVGWLCESLLGIQLVNDKSIQLAEALYTAAGVTSLPGV